MIDILILTLLAAIIAGLSVVIVIQQINFNSIKKKLEQKSIDLEFFEREVESLTKKMDEAELESSHGFVKFLSDSREWAFTYIEKLQTDLEALFKNIESGNNDPLLLLTLKQYLPKEDADGQPQSK